MNTLKLGKTQRKNALEVGEGQRKYIVNLVRVEETIYDSSTTVARMLRRLDMCSSGLA